MSASRPILKKKYMRRHYFFLRWFRSQSHYDAFDTIVNFFVSFFLECYYSSLFALSSSLCVLCVESLITCFKCVNYVWGHEEFCLCFAEILMCCIVAWRSETDVDALEATKEERRAEEALHAASLTIPRRFLYLLLGQVINCTVLVIVWFDEFLVLFCASAPLIMHGQSLWKDIGTFWAPRFVFVTRTGLFSSLYLSSLQVVVIIHTCVLFLPAFLVWNWL